MPRKGHKPNPGYAHKLIRLQQPRDEFCEAIEHRMLRNVFGVEDPSRERISHICQWRYKRKGAEVIVRRWVCRSCAVTWARKYIWGTGAESGGQALDCASGVKRRRSQSAGSNGLSPALNVGDAEPKGAG